MQIEERVLRMETMASRSSRSTRRGWNTVLELGARIRRGILPEKSFLGQKNIALKPHTQRDPVPRRSPNARNSNGCCRRAPRSGVAAFQPLVCDPAFALVQDNKALCWKKQARALGKAIIKEAAEQCGRGRVPFLEPPLDLKDALSKAEKEHDLNLAAWVGEEQTGLQAALRGFSAGGSLGLFIGPEGGFSEAEIARMRLFGLHTFSLGVRVLRMETAAMLAPALVLYQLGEMEKRGI